MVVEVVHTDVTQVSIAYVILGCFIVVYGLFSYFVKERLYLSEALASVVIGIVVGPYAADIINPRAWADGERASEITYELTRLVIGVQVLLSGIALPKAYLRKEALSLTVLLVGVMSAAWVISAGLICALFQPLSFLEALCISAAITPTDPVLAASITKGRYAEKHVPSNVRNLIVAESGANDGLGFPFIYLAIYLMRRTSVDAGENVGQEIWRWLYGVVIYQILLSCVWGALLGYLARKTLRWAEAKSLIDKENFFAYGLGLALLVLGTTGLFGSDDVLACFVAGNSFTWDDYYRIRTHEEETDAFQDILDALLSSAAFIYVGAIIPWDAYNTGGEALGIDPWRVVVLGIGVLLLRRLPAVLMLHKLIPALTTWDEALFTGWFGPIGVSAVYYIEIANRQVPDDGSRERLRALYEPIVLFLVFTSVMGHGTTIPISKLGPHIVRRTATMTQTRSMTQSRPPSRRPTIAAPTEGELAKASAPAPKKSLLQRLFGFGYEKQQPRHIEAKDVGAPSGARLQREVSARQADAEVEMEEQKKAEGQDESSGSSEETALEKRPKGATASSSPNPAAPSGTSSPKRRPPAQDLALPTTHKVGGGILTGGAGSSPISSVPGTPAGSVPGTPRRPAPAAREGSTLRHAASTSSGSGGGGILAYVEHALNAELRRERQEALGERAISWGEPEQSGTKE